jgi:xylose dehydrogenase (NAD/NADP)
MASQLRWGIPSTAGITKALLFALRGAPRSHLVAVANRDSGRARDCVAARGIPPVYRSYEELLADPNIDMVYIPLPHKRHAEGAVKAAPAGKHALVEQPLVTSRADLDAIEAAARDNHVVISRPSCRCTRCRPAWCWR